MKAERFANIHCRNKAALIERADLALCDFMDNPKKIASAATSIGKLELTNLRFKNEAELRTLIGAILAAVGRRVDELRPWRTRGSLTAPGLT
jgi:Flp pilus assembly CpaF family ATPase